MAETTEFVGAIEHESKAVHQELHDPYPERLLTNVVEWEEREKRLGDLPQAELDAADAEFKEIITEHLQPHRVNIDTLTALSEQLRKLIDEAGVGGPAADRAQRRLENVIRLVTESISDYGDSVRQHVIAGRIKDVRPEQGQRLLEEAYRSRGQRHERLIDALRTLTNLCDKELPHDLQGTSFPATDWRAVTRHLHFSVADLATSGPKREALGIWALDMDLVLKARAVGAAIQDTLKTKRADVT